MLLRRLTSYLRLLRPVEMKLKASGPLCSQRLSKDKTLKIYCQALPQHPLLVLPLLEVLPLLTPVLPKKLPRKKVSYIYFCVNHHNYREKRRRGRCRYGWIIRRRLLKKSSFMCKEAKMGPLRSHNLSSLNSINYQIYFFLLFIN